MELADKMAEHVERKALELIRKKVTAFGTFSLRQFQISRVPTLEASIDDLVYKLETEILCQSRGNQQQTVQFWVPTSWWQHLKHTIVRRCFGGFVLQISARSSHDERREQTVLKGPRLWQWIGRRIGVRVKAIEKTVGWEVLDSYPMADVPVPDDFGKPVRIVVQKGEVERDG